jgi:uncharacterized membrane protein (UPF0127 family)
MRLAALLFSALTLVSCGSRTVPLEDLRTRTVQLPDGSRIVAEVASTEFEMSRGMMHRDKLDPDRGMLFIHPTEGRHRYWMYQVRIPLDLIWMNKAGRIVEIAAEVPPCKGPPGECTYYGGHARAQYVLELAGGVAKKHGLKVGDVLRF